MSGIKDYAISLRNKRLQSQQTYVPAAIYEVTSGQHPNNRTYEQVYINSNYVISTGVHQIPSHWFSR
jgi:hypothetical protein